MCDLLIKNNKPEDPFTCDLSVRFEFLKIKYLFMILMKLMILMIYKFIHS